MKTGQVRPFSFVPLKTPPTTSQAYTKPSIAICQRIYTVLHVAKLQFSIDNKQDKDQEYYQQFMLEIDQMMSAVHACVDRAVAFDPSLADRLWDVVDEYGDLKFKPLQKTNEAESKMDLEDS